jgi:hypothetical protein
LFSPLEASERLGIALLSDERHFAPVVQPVFVAHEHKTTYKKEVSNFQENLTVPSM